MKSPNLTYLLLLYGLLMAQPLSAQDSTRQHLRPGVVKTNVLGPFSLFVEVPTTPRQSVQFSVQRINFSFFTTSRIFNFTPEYKFYVWSPSGPSAVRPAPKGLYVSPYLKYRTIADESSNKTSTVYYSMFGGGVVVGAQSISRGGFVMDAFLGGGYYPVINHRVTTANLPYQPYPPREPQPQQYRFDFRVGFCIGLAFDRPETP